MVKVFLFAGTTEGQEVAACCAAEGIPACVFTATDYGASLIPEMPGITVRDGRLQEADMEAVFREEAAPEAVVIDATHPYADIVTANIRQACVAAGLTYVRVLRESTYAADAEAGGDVWVDSPEEAAAWLAGQEGNVLLTTGSKELRHFTSIPDFQNRLYPRILPLAANVAATLELGYPASHLICMQGPFSLEMNTALLHFADARFLVTKDTGRAGGFSEKLEAARACGCRLVIIGRPLREEGISVEECRKLLQAMAAPRDPAGMEKD